MGQITLVRTVKEIYTYQASLVNKILLKIMDHDALSTMAW